MKEIIVLTPDNYLDYSNLISKVASDVGDVMSSRASPTLSKQESVTGLYKSIRKGIEGGQQKPPTPWINRLKFLPRILHMFCIVGYGAFRHRVKNIPPNSVVFRTWLVSGSFVNGGLADEYFRKLPEDLMQHSNVVFLYTTNSLRDLMLFSGVKKKKGQILSYGLLSTWDIFQLFFEYMLTAFVRIKKLYYFDNFNITPYIKSSLLLDYLCLRSFEAYMEKYKCKKLSKLNIKAFVYVYENQSWEKVCCKILKDKDIQLIGYQSSGVSANFLNFYPTKLDQKIHPMPDIVLTVGENFRRYLLTYGNYSIPVENFAALRFSSFNKKENFKVLPPNYLILRRILYVMPVHENQYFDLINDLVMVFAGSNIMVDIKPHPLATKDRDIRIGDLPINIRISNDIDLSTLSKVYDCVIFNDNSFGLEALMHGVKSYQYSRSGIYDDDRFIYFNLWNVFITLEDLFLLKEKILDGSYDKSFDVAAATKYFKNMYSSYNNQKLLRFMEILKH